MPSAGVGITFTVADAVIPLPSPANTLIVVVPIACAVTTPLASIDATSELPEDHLKFLLVAVSGNMVASN